MAKRDIEPDTVIYDTGYTQEFDFFDLESGYKLWGSGISGT